MPDESEKAAIRRVDVGLKATTVSLTLRKSAAATALREIAADDVQARQSGNATTHRSRSKAAITLTTAE